MMRSALMCVDGRCNDGSILLSDGVMDMSVYLDNSATLYRKRERSSIIASNE
jgi:hypothetical protein